jgi:hypothetical protein
MLLIGTLQPFERLVVLAGIAETYGSPADRRIANKSRILRPGVVIALRLG